MLVKINFKTISGEQWQNITTVIKLIVVSASNLTHKFSTFMDLSLFQFHISCAYKKEESVGGNHF